MKALLVATFIFTTFFSVKAQLTNLPAEGSAYTYASISMFGGSYRYVYTWGDEVNINDTIYTTFAEDNTEYLVREENDKWYLRNTNWSNLSDTDFLIYDWTVEAGDVVELKAPWLDDNGLSTEILIDSITTYTGPDLIERNQYNFSNLTYDGLNGRWIEGVGTDQRIIFSSGNPFIDGTLFLVCGEKNDALAYEHLPNGFEGYEDCDWVTISVSEQQNAEFNAYPNPFQSSLQLEFSKKVKTLKVNSVTGSLIGFVDKMDDTSVTLELIDLNAGMYMIQVLFQDGTVLNRRIIKQN